MISTGVDRKPLLIMTFTTLIGSHYCFYFRPRTSLSRFLLHKTARSHFGGLLIFSLKQASKNSCKFASLAGVRMSCERFKQHELRVHGDAIPINQWNPFVVRKSEWIWLNPTRNTLKSRWYSATFWTLSVSVHSNPLKYLSSHSSSWDIPEHGKFSNIVCVWFINLFGFHTQTAKKPLPTHY